MYYCDTSFVTPLVLPESASDALTAFLKKRKPPELAVSLWTIVEFAGLISRRLRMGELTERQAELARAVFQGMVARSYRVLLPLAADYDLAAKFLENYKTGLRAGDALGYREKSWCQNGIQPGCWLGQGSHGVQNIGEHGNARADSIEAGTTSSGCWHLMCAHRVTL